MRSTVTSQAMKAATALAALLTLAAPLHAAPSETLSLLTWKEFVSEAVVTNMRDQHGITLRISEFTSDDERIEMLRKNPRRYDLVNGDTNAVDRLRREKLIQRLDYNQIPNATHINKVLKTPSRFSIPYSWGYTGIAWRTDRVKKPVRDYKSLFALAKDNPGKVGLIDSNFEALSSSLFAWSTPPYTMLSPVEVAAARRLLKPHLPNLKSVSLNLDETDGLVTGALIAQQAYNGDIAYLRDTYKVPLAFHVPEPGCLIWTENFMLLKDATNLNAAYRFLNAINDPKLAARNAETIRYASANKSAQAHYSKAFRDDQIIRPVLEDLVKCQFYTGHDKSTEAAINAPLE